MKKNFSDYPIYVIPDPNITDSVEAASGIRIIIFSTTDLSPIEKAKLEQIVGAIDIAPSEVSYSTLSHHQTSEQCLNTLKLKKVSYGISFSNENPENELFQIFERDEFSIILSCPVAELIQDEEASITTRRKSLWMAMKNWK